MFQSDKQFKKFFEGCKSNPHFKSLKTALKRQIAQQASEADTVTLVRSILCDILGFDRHSGEVTAEYAVRGKYCDLAIKDGDEVKMLVEVKSSHTTLNDRHRRQALDYAEREKVRFVLLTNGAEWVVYQLKAGKPSSLVELLRFDFRELSTRKTADMECLFLLTKTAITSSRLSSYADRNLESTEELVVAALLNDGDLLKSVRTAVRKASKSNRLYGLEELRAALGNVVKH